MAAYVIAYDVGTTGLKTCLFKIDKNIEMMAAASDGYKLYLLEGGGAEQDPEDFWSALCRTTHVLFEKCPSVKPSQIEGVSFCSQAQALILVDKDGNALTRSFSYLDQRARKEMKDGIGHGLTISGGNVFKLIPSLLITGAAPVSVKDPVWKYNWVKNNEPEKFKKVSKWLDVKEYLIARMTGKFVMTYDSAFGTLLYNLKKKRFSPFMCKMLGVNYDHMPPLIASTDCAGTLTKKAADELGLVEGVKVFGGGMDANLMGVGAGATALGDTHVYSGTSGWVGTITDKPKVDISTLIAAIVAAQPDKYNYYAELETAGKCLDWVKDHVALDEVGIYIQKKHITEDFEHKYLNLYEYMTEVVRNARPGCDGVIFTPWMLGNRCPFEDPNARSMFFNVGLDTGKTELIRAVLEGICYHLRWMLEASAKNVQPSRVMRFVGGGALNPFTCQLLADITGHVVETVPSPQNSGAVGAAACVGIGLKLIPNFDKIKDFIPVTHTYKPDLSLKADVYDRNFKVFKNLWPSNKENFAALNVHR